LFGGGDQQQQAAAHEFETREEGIGGGDAEAEHDRDGREALGIVRGLEIGPLAASEPGFEAY
jgi:hypothetical protein